MVRRHNNQLPDNLPQLQNLIKRDPASYKEEFEQQYRHFLNTVEVFRLNPSQPNKALDELVMFLAQVAGCYPERLAELPQRVTELLLAHSTALEAGTRLQLVKALVLLRNKGLLAPDALLELCFRLLRCRDRALRRLLQQHVVADLAATCAKNKDRKLRSRLQALVFNMLRENDKRAAKVALDVLAELYSKGVWDDAKTVNVIASGCFSQHGKVAAAALNFFLGSDKPSGDGDGSSDSEDEPSVREVAMANKVNKKSRKRERQLEKVKRLVVKDQKKRAKAPAFSCSALQLVHNPQEMAERLMRLLDGSCKRFELRLAVLDVTSRLVGLHELFLFNLYPYLQRFLRPQQREVTRLLQFAAQASHALVPPDVLRPLLRALVDGFVTERNSADAMAVGLNAVREVCARCPLAMDADLLQDLVRYRTHRERAVSMAARSLVQLFRRLRPDLLHRRDRGRPTEATDEIRAPEYGEVRAHDHIPGAEVLLNESQQLEVESASGSESDDDQWLDIEHSSDEGDNEPNAPTNEKKEQARQVVLERFLTDEDFRRIEVAQARKQVEAVRKGGAKRKAAEEAPPAGDLVRLADIENVHKKRRHDKQARMETVRRGQEDRERFGYRDGRMNEHCSKTNREKRKNKNFLMLKHKARGKVKRSFKDKQVALRNHLVKQKRMK